MLAELRVRNLGVIEDVVLELSGGMTALTGETGAGKTLLVEALQLVLGARVNSAMQRGGSDEAVIEARFFRERGGQPQDRELVLARSIKTQGRSRAQMDGQMVPLSALADAGSGLVDILGQNDHHSLVLASAQRRALDCFAGIDTGELEAVGARLAELRKELDELGGDAAQRSRAIDLLNYEIAEIDSAQISDPDELDSLMGEQERLADLSAQRESIEKVLSTLDGDADAVDTGASAALASAVLVLKGVKSLSGLESRVETARVEVADVASELRRMLELSQDDPEALETLWRRIRLLHDIAKRYGGTLEAALSYERSARDRLDDLVKLSERAELLAAEIDAVSEEHIALENAVRSARKLAIAPFTAALHDRLCDLAMKGARFDVEISDKGAGEPIRFLLSANPGEPLQALAKVASGGELARAMLAIRLVSSGGPATMVFDEVDAGVGGEAARYLARSLKEVSASHQVLVVTHLAQVAAFADHHLAIEKSTSQGRTVTSIRKLTGQERVVEISRMLSGHPDSATARAHATELLALGKVSEGPPQLPLR